LYHKGQVLIGSAEREGPSFVTRSWTIPLTLLFCQHVLLILSIHLLKADVALQLCRCAVSIHHKRQRKNHKKICY